jgi:predicted phosphodiesterase
MHLALIADVHGNLEALDAVLEDLDRRAPRARIVCAGDLVGYGPDPEACIERLGGRGALCVLGNHDEMVLGRRDFTRCVRAGILAAVWSREHLGPDAHAFLRGLPAWLDTGDAVVACHGDLADADQYVSTAPRAQAALAQLQRLRPAARLLVCGHTHRALLFGERSGALPTPTGRQLANAGSSTRAPSARPARAGRSRAMRCSTSSAARSPTWASATTTGRPGASCAGSASSPASC